MTHITGETPSAEEVSRLLAAVDKDESGTVSLAEFLESVGEWLSESATAPKRFKSVTAEEEKKELHHQIKGFFSQFKKAEDYEAVRQKISEAVDPASSMDTGSGWFGFRSEGQTSQQKLEFLQHYHALVGDLGNTLVALSSPGLDRLNALATLEKLLSITEVFERPSERSAIADDLAHLFEALVRDNLTDVLVSILQTSSDALTQASALKCLAMFVPGPRVPSTPVSSLMHPKQYYFKRMAISSDAPQVSARFLNFNSQITCESAIMFVNAMVSFDYEIRDYFLQNFILSLLCPLVLQTTPTNTLVLISQSLAALCGVTHSASPLPQWELIQPAFTPLGHLLFSEDDQILLNVLSAFSLVLPGMRPDFSIIARILEIISSHPTPAVVQHAFQVIVQVAKFDAIQTTSFMARGLLDAVKFGLSSDHPVIRSASLDILEVLAYVRQQFQPLLNAGVLEIVANLLPQDDSLRVKLVNIILSLTQSSALSSAMAAQGYLQLLCGGLCWFKEFDNVLLEAYAVDGPTFNYELISDLVSSIENILMVGEAERMEHNQALNMYALNFDLDCINRIHDVLAGLSDIAAAGHESWRRERDASHKGRLEQRLFSLLHRIRSAMENTTTFQINGLLKDGIINAITKVLEQFGANHDPNASNINYNSNTVIINGVSSSNGMDGQSSTTTSTPTSTVLIKCYLPDDIRVFEVSRDISYEDLMALMVAKYGRSMLVSFLDTDGDPVRLEPSSMSAAFAIADAASSAASSASSSSSSSMMFPTLKLQLADRNATSNHPQPSAVPASPPSEDEDFASSSSNRVASKKRSRAGDQLTLNASAPPTAFGSRVVFAKSQGLDLVSGADLMKNEFSAMRLVQKNHSFKDIRKASTKSKFGGQEFEAVLQHLSEGNALNREQFSQVMNLLGITDPLVIEQNFHAHDIDGDGQIDFREFAVSLATLAQGSNEDRLRLMFRSYDTDGSGNLSIEEVFEIFRVALQLNGTVTNDAELLQTVTDVFKEIDLDGNGEISFDEFKLAVESGKLPITFESSS